LTLRARQSPHRLVLEPRNGRIQATNELGAVIQFVVVADAERNLFAGEDLAVGQRAELLPIEPTAAAHRLRKIGMEHRLATPEELAAGGYARVPPGGMGPIFVDPRYYGMGEQFMELSDNLLQEAIAAWTSAQPQAGNAWEGRTYVAVTETGPEIALGVEGAKEEGSFHVILGNW
jgi:hypothetical protein